VDETGEDDDADHPDARKGEAWEATVRRWRSNEDCAEFGGVTPLALVRGQGGAGVVGFVIIPVRAVHRGRD